MKETGLSKQQEKKEVKFSKKFRCHSSLHLLCLIIFYKFMYHRVFIL